MRVGGELTLLRVEGFVLDLDGLLGELLDLRRQTGQALAREVARLVGRERLLQRQVLQDVAGHRRRLPRRVGLVDRPQLALELVHVVDVLLQRPVVERALGRVLRRGRTGPPRRS